MENDPVHFTASDIFICMKYSDDTMYVAHMHAHTYHGTHTCIHVHICTNIHTNTYKQTHYIHTWSQTYLHACVHTHACIHTHTHTHTENITVQLNIPGFLLLLATRYAYKHNYIVNIHVFLHIWICMNTPAHSTMLLLICNMYTSIHTICNNLLSSMSLQDPTFAVSQSQIWGFARTWTTQYMLIPPYLHTHLIYIHITCILHLHRHALCRYK